MERLYLSSRCFFVNILIKRVDLQTGHLLGSLPSISVTCVYPHLKHLKFLIDMFGHYFPLVKASKLKVTFSL